MDLEREEDEEAKFGVPVVHAPRYPQVRITPSAFGCVGVLVCLCGRFVGV